jgi:fructokinase
MAADGVTPEEEEGALSASDACRHMANGIGSNAPLIGCIEGGGTKWNLALASATRASARGPILTRERVPTTTPDETLSRALAFFERATQEFGAMAAVGIGSFGPVDVQVGSPTWGRILPTPKPGWAGTDIVTPFAARFGCPVALDTDVNAAVLAERSWGAAHGCDNEVYVTVGTGIGGGALVGGDPVHGHRHPEMGHVPVRRHAGDEAFAGICPFHGDCLEGLASGPAIKARWGVPLSELPREHPGRTIIAGYLAQLAVMHLALFSPQRIVLGGGVLATPGLLPLVRAEVERLSAGYFGYENLDTVIVAPGLGDDAGIFGALALGQRALG